MVNERSCLVLTLIFCAISLFWFLYVIKNIYFIIFPGLRKLFIIFLLHFVLFYYILFHSLIRPVWTAGVSKFIYDRSWLCHFHGRLSTVTGLFELFLSTAFGYHKIVFYAQISDTNSIMKCVRFLFVLYAIFMFLGATLMKSAPHMEQNIRLCFQYPPRWVNLGVSFIWVLLNSNITYMTFQSAHLRGPGFDHLEREIKLNTLGIPILVFTTAAMSYVRVSFEG